MSMIKEKLAVAKVGIARLFAILTLALISSFKCEPNEINKDSILVIDLAYKFQLIKTEGGELINVEDTLRIVSYKDIVVYRVPFQRVSTIVGVDTSGNILEERIISEKKGFNHLVYRQNSNYGVMFDSIKELPTKKFKVDSFLTARTFKDFKFFNSSNDSLIEVNEYEKGIRIEKYVPKLKFDQSYADSLLLYFTKKLTDKPYSFSRDLEKQKRMNLSKVRILYNSIPKGAYDFEVPKREFVFEIIDVTLEDKQEIMYYIKEFLKQNK